MAPRTKTPGGPIVVLSHLGFPQDVKLATRVHRGDVIVSGHTHNRLDRPVWRDMLIQSGCHGSFIGRLDLTIEGRRIAGVRHRLIPVDETIAPDPEMDALIENVMALTDPCWPRWSATPALGFTETPIMIRPWNDVLLAAIARVAETEIDESVASSPSAARHTRACTQLAAWQNYPSERTNSL